MALVAASRFVGEESSSEINAERSEALRIAVPLGKPSDTQNMYTLVLREETCFKKTAKNRSTVRRVA